MTPDGQKRQVDLQHAVRMRAAGRWPTPNTVDAKGGSRKGATGQQLTHVVRARALWPTPTVTGNNNRKGASPTSGDGLLTVAKNPALWPTPMAADGERHSLSYGRGNLTLLGQARRWPTPRSADAERRPSRSSPNTVRRLASGKANLGEFVQERAYWPTPTASPWRSGRASEATLSRNSRPLNEVALSRTGPAEPLASPGPSPSTPPPGKLSVIFTEYLMGFPSGWTDLGDSETQSYLKWRKSSGAPSSRRKRTTPATE